MRKRSYASLYARNVLGRPGAGQAAVLHRRRDTTSRKRARSSIDKQEGERPRERRSGVRRGVARAGTSDVGNEDCEQNAWKQWETRALIRPRDVGRPDPGGAGPDRGASVSRCRTAARRFIE